MKRISLLLIAISFCAAAALRAQDAAVEERLNKLTGQVQDLLAAQEALGKKIEALQTDFRELHDRLNTANTSVATLEDLKRVAGQIQDVDRKRISDNELILKQIENLSKVAAVAPPPTKTSRPPKESAPPASTSEKGFEHVIKQGDNLSLIAQAYREKGIKVSAKDIQDANPGLNDRKLKVGQKIFIPAPKQ